jgi:hypothetical protein
MQVRLIYQVSAGERELLSTDRHEPLVEMVNRAKVAGSGQPGGSFYINEYRDVLVPVPSGCVYVGNYRKDLEFDFEGAVLGPRAPEGLSPGDEWPGPHVGVSYVLTADGNDIKYDEWLTPTRQRTVRLSTAIGVDAARSLASRLGRYKGKGGGRLYINEAYEFFSPVQGSNSLLYIYLGGLEDDDWFPAPNVIRDDD